MMDTFEAHFASNLSLLSVAVCLLSCWLKNPKRSFHALLTQSKGTGNSEIIVIPLLVVRMMKKRFER
jgi:hypothetical protein